MDNQHTFKKAERLSLKKEIDGLFKQGESFISYPLRIVYLKQKPLLGEKVSVLISVPKRKIKLAVKRNRLKRLIREAFRLNKSSLIRHCEEKESGLIIAFLFIGNDLYGWKEIETALQKALVVLKEKTV